MSVMGIDIGTTGCKACAFTDQGALIAAAYREYAMEAGAHGVYELNPEKVWEGVKEVICRVNREAGADAVLALALSVSGDEIVPADARGGCLGNAIMSSDQRGAQAAARLAERFGRAYIYERTGIPVHRKYGINRAAWYRECRPDIYDHTWRFLTWEDFILRRMGFDDPVCSDSAMARLMVLDIRTKEMANEFLEYLGIDPGRFSRVVPSGTPIGTLSVRMAGALGFAEPPLVVAGGFDQSCAALGAGLHQNYSAMVGTGTMESLCVCADQPLMTEALLNGNYPCNIHALRGKYACTATNVCGGAMLKWLRSAVCDEECAQRKDAYDMLLGGLGAVPTGLLVLPHFAGAGPPSKDAESLGAILGLTLKHGKKDIVQAVLEGVTYDLAQNIELIERGAGIQIASLTAVGGGARSAYWLQLKADITGKTVRKTAVEEAGCVAGAMLGWMALHHKDVTEAADTFVRIDREFAPDPVRRRAYASYFEAYKQVYPAVRDISHRLNALRQHTEEA